MFADELVAVDDPDFQHLLAAPANDLPDQGSVTIRCFANRPKGSGRSFRGGY
jgi:hypothetical protein